MLTALGFTLTSRPASWEDVGGPERGPKLIGGPAYDEWAKDDISVIVQDGMIVAVEKQYPMPEDFPF